eukprot:Tbor_TRINITY_DN6091_c0_g1::TRINITY_DN6091_c0_g1_i3::g.11186::m.11186
MLIDLVEVYFAYFQYIYLILNIHNINYPILWEESRTVLSVTSLGRELFQRQIDFLSEFRIFFTIAAVVIPLILILLGLFAINRKRVVMWYLGLLLGIFLIGAGITSLLISSIEVGNSIFRKSVIDLVIIGSCIVFLCGVLFLIQRITNICEKKKAFTFENLEDAMAQETAYMSLMEEFEGFALVIILFAVGIIFTGAFPSVLESLRGGGSRDILDVLFPIGCFLILLSVIVLIWTLIGFFHKGRIIRWKISIALTSNTMLLLLVAMSFLYIPIASSSILMFNCNTLECKANTRLSVEGALIVPTDFSVGEACTTCAIAENQMCPTSLQQSICQGESEPRLESALYVPCRKLQSYFWPASSLCILAFVIGLPVAFLKLIKQSTDNVITSIPHNPRYTCENDIWASKVRRTNNVSKFLYQPMEYRFRYWKVFETVRRLIIVIVCTYVFRVSFNPSFIAIYVCLVVHTVFGVMSFIFSPFIHHLENKSLCACCTLLVIFDIFAILVAHGIDVPVWLTTTVLLIVLIIPFILLIICIFYLYREWRKEKESVTMERNCEMKNVIKQAIKKAERVNVQSPTRGNANNRESHKNIRQSGASPISEWNKYHSKLAEELNAMKEKSLLSKHSSASSTATSINIANSPTDSLLSCDTISKSPKKKNIEKERSMNNKEGKKVRQKRNASSPNDTELVCMHPLLSVSDGSRHRSPCPPKRRERSARRWASGRGEEELMAIIARITEYRRRSNAKSLSSDLNPIFKSLDSNKTKNEVFVSTNSKKSSSQTSDGPEGKTKSNTIDKQSTALNDIMSDLLRGEITIDDAVKQELDREREVLFDFIQMSDLKNNRELGISFNVWLLVAGLCIYLALGFCTIDLRVPEKQQLYPSNYMGDWRQKTPVTHELLGYDSWSNFTKSCCCMAHIIPFDMSDKEFNDGFYKAMISGRDGKGTAWVPNASSVSINNPPMPPGRGAESAISPLHKSSELRIRAGVHGEGITAVEQWVCENGLIKERVRVVRTSSSQEEMVKTGVTAMPPPLGVVIPYFKGYGLVDGSIRGIRGLCSTDFISASCAPRVVTSNKGVKEVEFECEDLALSDAEKRMW